MTPSCFSDAYDPEPDFDRPSLSDLYEEPDPRPVLGPFWVPFHEGDPF